MVGEKVNDLKVGDKVGVSPVRFSDMSCRYCKQGDHQMCVNRIYLYGVEFGGFCTHMQIDHNWAIKIPQGLDLKEVAPLLCAGITVYAPLKRYNKIGGKCAVLGIGGLGHLALQYANKLGMNVTAFTTRLNNIESLKQLGANDAQHSVSEEELKKQEGKYDVVCSTLYIEDPKLYKLHQRLTKPGGVYIMLGAPNSNVNYEIDSEFMVANEIKVVGSNVGSIGEVKDMLEFSAHYNVKSINEYFSFEDFPKALHRAEKEAPRYRCVINVTDWAKKNGFDK